ncbi:MAG: SusC/RagA family TonB-linked outer membrane protein [Aquaticitalea sp.]
MKLKLTWLMTLFMAFMIQISFAQEKSVSGAITAAADGLPLPGVNVIVKGTTRGVQSDFDGNYTIKVNAGETLVFSFVGMKNTEKKVGSSSTIDVQMLEDAASLDEVVVVAYGTSTMAKTPASITTFSVAEIEDRANASVLQNLQGQVSGLNIATGTGLPGGDSTIVLRGQGSLNGNIEPLFVIDGIPVDEDNFRSINQNDIETFSILKDAAATSIYGNRGGNGVILITTKKGRYNEAMKFRYTSNYGNTQLQDAKIELLNSRELLQLERQQGVARGAGLTDAEIAAIANQSNTYWTDFFFRTGTTTSHDLAITSGSEKTTNFTSLGYFNQEGIFLNTDLQRFNIRNNFNGKSENDKFNYGTNLSINFSKQNQAGGAGSNAIFFAPFTAALRGLPYLSPYDADGSITSDGGIAPGDIAAITANQNAAVPYILLNSANLDTERDEEVKLLGSFNASYNFMKNVTAGIQLGGDYSSVKSLTILNPSSILGPFQANGPNNTTEFGGIQTEGYRREFRFNSVASLNYTNTFASKHTVDVTVFTEYTKSHLDGLNFRKAGLDPRILGTGSAFIPGDTFEDANGNGVIDAITDFPYIPTIGAFKVSEGLFSYFGLLNYDYDGKYGISASLRRDNSFRFVEDNKWGTFYSISGRWNVDEESFMDDSVINLLKLRASYGTSGNQRIQNAEFSALNETRDLYGQGSGYNGTTATFATQLANIDLRWEELTQTNVGIDFGLWNNKLSGSLDVYRKVTEDLFQSRPISLTNATSAINANVGSMENKGFEANFKYVIYDKSSWNISVNANASYNKNEVLEVAGTTGRVFGGGATILAEGHPANSFYLVPYAGVNPANGNPLFVTADGSLSESFSDEDRRFTDKQSFPVWQGGFGASISYKGFELSTQWAWVADIWLNNLDLAQLEDTSTLDDGANRSEGVLRAWQNVGDITDVPRFGNAYGAIDYINSVDRYLEDASYLRMRNATLGYSLPQKFLEKTPITGLRMFVQGENLVTFSSFRGWDAENGFRTTNRGQYPTPKIYTLGVTINF